MDYLDHFPASLWWEGARQWLEAQAHDPVGVASHIPSCVTPQGQFISVDISLSVCKMDIDE